jgi:DNA-binding NarL/FixJ family response regulator
MVAVEGPMRPPADDESPPGSGQASGPEPDGSGEGALRVLLVDDHTFFRAGLRTLLEEQRITVLEARSGEAALELAAKVAPDVVLMDLHMPGMSGIEATRRLSDAMPGTPVVMLTMSADDAHVVEAVRAGARGYLLKDAELAEIVAGVRAAAAGESWISPRVTAVLLDTVRDASASSPEDAGGPELSDRERAILRLIAAGRDNTQIGREMHISPATVKNHVSSILAKLEVANRVEAAVYAVRRGLA